MGAAATISMRPRVPSPALSAFFVQAPAPSTSALIAVSAAREAASTSAGAARSKSCLHTTAVAHKKKQRLSPLHKTNLLRQDRIDKGIAPGAGGRRGGKEADGSSMPLAEAAKILQAQSVTRDWAAYELNVLCRPAATVQMNAMRGRVFLPHDAASQNAARRARVLVFASGDAARAATAAGADKVGSDETVLDALVAGTEPVPSKLLVTPEFASLFRRPEIARFLGPKGLMPSAKRGTITSNMAEAVREARGALDWKGDSRGYVKAAVGRVNFESDKLAENVNALLACISDVTQGGAGDVTKEPTAKARKLSGISRVLLKTTQGPSIRISDL